MNTAHIRKLKDKVEYCLKHYEETRNSDITLTIKIWEVFHEHSLIRGRDDKLYVSVQKLFDLPREDNIKRVRATIQNVDHKYLPTKPEIRKKRGINEDTWRSYLGYPVAGVDGQTL